jgi:hypothetical protein
MSATTALYAGNSLGPNHFATNQADFIKSGFDTLLLGLFHIGRGPNDPDPVQGQRTGDIVFNDPTDPNHPGVIVISQGAYTAPAAWPGQLKSLLTGSGGPVSTMGISIGGAGCLDYHTISRHFVVNGTIGPTTVLYQNFQRFKSAFPFIQVIDFDCEEFDAPGDPYQWVATLVAFGQMLKTIGFDLTFCPYNRMADWITVLQGLYARQGPTVRWMNLQCYDGGSPNHPADWAKAVDAAKVGADGSAFIVPGLWCCNTQGDGSTPPKVVKSFAGWKKINGKLPGGFIWNYEDILDNQNSTACDPSYLAPKTSRTYHDAILKGLT